MKQLTERMQEAVCDAAGAARAAAAFERAMRGEWWNGAAWTVASPDPIVGEADRGDTLADIDRAVGPALDGLCRRYLPGRDKETRETIRREIVEYIGDVLGAEQATR